MHLGLQTRTGHSLGTPLLEHSYCKYAQPAELQEVGLFVPDSSRKHSKLRHDRTSTRLAAKLRPSSDGNIEHSQKAFGPYSEQGRNAETDFDEHGTNPGITARCQLTPVAPG